MGKADAGLEQGGGICQDLRPDMLGGGSFGNVVRVRDVVDDAAYQGECWADSTTGWPTV